ncbi:MAG: molybdopterin molybdotransferase MoeA [Acidobacteria bacterium]|nr:molybdopterin molybdotransferase MoeA [Acidobacteriota bacterium]
MPILKFQQAREMVIEQIGQSTISLKPETVPLLDSLGRVLAEPIHADRDFPPFPRATRDGFAVRCGDFQQLPVRLRLIGQVRAGSSFDGTVGERECVEIMTGAPLPKGADAVVMVEYTRQQEGQREGWIEIQRGVAPGENVVGQGSESRKGNPLLPERRRIGYGEIGLLAAVGQQNVTVCRQPEVAILPTGDEVVELGETPGPYQIRNSNSYSLQAQVASMRAVPLPLGIAPDHEDRLREMITEGLRTDLLLLSGGVSMGKFDLVEKVLAELGAEFFFDGVAIQPGRPLVFGRAQGTFFFGLPGNPLSTMVTFELFVRPALALLAGEPSAPLLFLRALLAKPLRRKPGLTAFLPALLEGSYHHPTVSPVEWKGSGDLPSLNRANCYLVVPEEMEEIPAGEWVSVLPR